MTTVLKRNNWAIWRDVIFALFVREIRTGFNDKFGLAWAVLQPLSFIFLLSYLRGLIAGSESHTVPTFEFMMYGMLLIQLFLETLNNSANSINKNKALFAFRQVQPISSVLASSCFYLLVKLFVFVLILLLMFLLKMDIKIDDPLFVITNVIAIWVIATSLGLLFAIGQCYVPEITKVRSILTRPLFFISGVFFSMQDIPKEYWPYLDWNPILHAIELTRHAAYNTYPTEAVSEFYLLTCTIVLLFFALAVYHISWKQALSR
ncbi:ABC transporter permease [Pseudoalteromonas sp. CST5]|uniref:ABC transporter permease n=1 Tax=unclassified Pseudoalteromonas TaxID=194690 RepID=UPI002358FB23|nr:MULTISPECIES: ABC transporter permease [unclassified Pseudoalteromonas]MDC9513045.1 ABC transporter permease [Pseudoalteromonas sp. CST1]MDC9537218.1 ABC transporter permease [Pseudoalteromonas sp. CST3]MDC9541532.1 ABC transporter permease [Pseudoalteromonas sp. CST2]MDC9544409.1 ABC transporter permease [Pseudoalteromonas sp. CST4]MDC9548563.1 ABC transporter permease [Pseudoalteromonas sp. CST5]